MIKVYEVNYWDPCNGMGGHSVTKGVWLDKAMAQAYADRNNEGFMMQNSHTVRPIDVIETADEEPDHQGKHRKAD